MSDSKTNNAGMSEDHWIFKSKKNGITKKWCQFAATSKVNHGFNLLTYIKNIVENDQQILIDNYTARLSSQIRHFLVRKYKEGAVELVNIRNEHCPYTVGQYREMIQIYSKMLTKKT